MSPDDERRRVDGLLASYGEMRATLERLDERSDSQERELAAGREALREAMRHTEKMLAAIGVECEKNSARVERKLDEQAAAQREAMKAQAAAHEKAVQSILDGQEKKGLGSAAKAAIIVAIITANGAVISALAGGPT